MGGLKPHLIPLPQLHHSVPGVVDPTVHIGREGGHHHRPVSPQLHAAHGLERCAEELKLVDARHLASEPACLCAVVVLAVVGDPAEAEDIAGGGDGAPEADRESRTGLLAAAARGPRGTP